MRRPSGPQEIVVITRRSPIKAYVDIGRFGDGRPGEVWLNVAKCGSDLRTMYSVWAMTASKALQYGMPLKELAGTLRNVKDEMGGVMDLGPDHELTEGECSSLWDAIGQFLEVEARDE
jgi:ribonucleoside-diphosphate reductase alpha chain